MVKLHYTVTFQILLHVVTFHEKLNKLSTLDTSNKVTRGTNIFLTRYYENLYLILKTNNYICKNLAPAQNLPKNEFLFFLLFFFFFFLFFLFFLIMLHYSLMQCMFWCYHLCLCVIFPKMLHNNALRVYCYIVWL